GRERAQGLLPQHARHFRRADLPPNRAFPALHRETIGPVASMAEANSQVVIVARPNGAGKSSFIDLYQPLASTWAVYDNSLSGPVLIICGDDRRAPQIVQPDLSYKFIGAAKSRPNVPFQAICSQLTLKRLSPSFKRQHATFFCSTSASATLSPL